jgi:hypothetical protein
MRRGNEPPAPRRVGAHRPGWLGKLLLASQSVLVTLALVEAARWVVAPVRYHEWLIWEPEGHIAGHLRAEGSGAAPPRMGGSGPDVRNLRDR